MTKRYTAIIEIVEVEEIPATPPANRHLDAHAAKKDSKELAKFVVRDSDLEGLKAKVQKHIELV